MSYSARTIFVFGLYLTSIGLIGMVAPQFVLSLLGFDAVEDVGFRFASMLAFLISLYYLLAARHNVRSFFQWTVYVRPLVIVFLMLGAAAGLVKTQIILIGVVDLLGAIWTGMALRSERLSSE